MVAPDRASGAGEKTAGVQPSARTWRPPSGEGSEGLDASRGESGGSAEKRRWASHNSDDWLQPERSANHKFPYTRPKEKADRRSVDSGPDPSAHSRGGKASDASASTDPFIIVQDEEHQRMERRVKIMDKDQLLSMSEGMRQGFFSPSGEQVICAELRKRGLPVPGFEPLALKEEEEEDESSGRPPSY